MSEEAIRWAKQQNVYDCIVEWAKKPTTVVGSAPVKHLTALAMLGRVDILEHYNQSFEKGDRLGFVPYITQDYIKRALDKAYEYKDHPITR
ncbi:hypothetical protein LMG33818_000815 [Halomonadaceae bacterium LMG 33818]